MKTKLKPVNVIVFHPSNPELSARVQSGDPERGCWDVFSTSPDYDADRSGLYRVECPYADRFLLVNPDFHYVGSEDDLHGSPRYPPARLYKARRKRKEAEE